MQKLICILFLGMTVFSYGQKTSELEPFEALSTSLGATVRIMKSAEHRIAIIADPEVLPYVDVEVDGSTLKITPGNLDLDYSAVQITVSTPRIQAIAMSNGGVTSMDSDFSPRATLVVSAEDDSVVDLSNIAFKTLITSTDGPDMVLYKSVQTLVSTSIDGKHVSLKN